MRIWSNPFRRRPAAQHTSRSPKAAVSSWRAEPAESGLRLTWEVLGQPVGPSDEGDRDAEVPESHRLLHEHLRHLCRDGLLLGDEPAVTARDRSFVLSPACLYAAGDGSAEEGEEEGLSAVRGLMEWLPLVLDSSLPERAQVRIGLGAVGDFATAHFALRLSLQPQDRRPYSFERRGPFLAYTDGAYALLPPEAFQLCNAVAEAEPWPQRLPDRLRRWASLRPIAVTAGAEMDLYLHREEALLVEAVRPLPAHMKDGSLHLEAGLGGAFAGDSVAASFQQLDLQIADAAFRRDVAALRTVQEVYQGQGPAPGARMRFVVSEAAREAIRSLKERPALRGSDIARGVLCPESVFASPGFDLSDFSDRVVGIGVYVYRAIPYLAPPRDGSRRGWFDWDGSAGEEVEFGVDLDPIVEEGAPDAAPAAPSERLSLTREGALSRLRQLLDTAAEAGEEFLEVSPGRFLRREELEGWVQRAEALAAARTPTDRKRLVLQILENIEDREYVSEFAGTGRESPRLDPPARLASSVRLMEHQMLGYSWLRALEGTDFSRPGGGLLADDMGLGKTLQVLCCLAHRRQHGAREPALIVAPVSVLENWRREAAAFLPGEFPNVRTVQGAPLPTPGEMQGADIVLTSYETLRGPLQLAAARVDWGAIVLDEAQRAKNPSTRTSSAIKGLKARLRIAMTATPVENSLADLWNLFDILHPGYLGSLRDFHREHILAWGRADDAGREVIAERLVERLRPVLLRRTKAEVLDLPPKREQVLRVGMSAAQARSYRQLIEQVELSLVPPLPAIQRLLNICMHPAIESPDEANQSCPKLEASLNVLQSIAARAEKALVFISRRRMQTLFRRACADRFDSPPEIINGDTPPTLRQSMIDAFSAQEGFGVLVLSPRAAGLGLNVTAANHVLHYSREWNPAVEAQATDRVYRIGQTRPVTVYYPMVTGDSQPSAEETLDALLREKRSLARSIVRPTSELSVTPEDFLRRLFPSPPPRH